MSTLNQSRKNGKGGVMREKKTTVRDIAQDAGVSIATVSRFLNQDYSAMSDATKQRINEVITERGYVNQKARMERTVAIVIPTLKDPFFAMTVETVSGDLAAAGFSVQLCLTHDSLEEEERIIRSLLTPAVSGIVYMSTVTSKDNCYEVLKAKKKPFVVLDSYLSEYNVPALAFSNGIRGMYTVTKRLLEAGHRQIAYLSGLRYGMFENHRYQGYINALLDSGIPVNPQLARFVGFTMEDGISAFRDLRASGESFTAVICESDPLAAGVYRVCAQEGVSIPGELSVVGFNNSTIAEMLEPPLTSVDQRMELLSEKAVRMLQQQINGEALTDRVEKIEPRLVVRNSVRSLNTGSGKELI